MNDFSLVEIELLYNGGVVYTSNAHDFISVLNYMLDVNNPLSVKAATAYGIFDNQKVRVTANYEEKCIECEGPMEFSAAFEEMCATTVAGPRSRYCDFKPTIDEKTLTIKDGNCIYLRSKKGQ